MKALPIRYVHKIRGKIIHPLKKSPTHTKTEVPNGNIQKSYRSQAHNAGKEFCPQVQIKAILAMGLDTTDATRV
jgi:hypothetical protein